MRALVEALREEAGGGGQLAIAFVSEDWVEHLEEFCELIRVYGRVPMVCGCTGSGLIGRGEEHEWESGFSLLMLNVPGLNVLPLPFSQHQIEECGGPCYWQMEAGVEAADLGGWVVLADPYRVEVESWLRHWNHAYPTIPTLGGLASARGQGRDFTVFLNGKVVEGGGLVIGLGKPLELVPVVSQGCRPIGEPLTLTQVENNLIHTLGGKTAFEVLSEVLSGMTPGERERARGNILIGLANSEYVEEFKPGDFLIRNILGADPASGVLAVGARPRQGQTFQFQLRDGQTAHEELEALLEQHARRKGGECRPLASLVFSCNGRGKNLFGRSNHDAECLVRHLGSHPSSGFFCNGEIGPVGAATFIHGYTASIALLYESGAAPSGAQPLAG